MADVEAASSSKTETTTEPPAEAAPTEKKEAKVGEKPAEVKTDEKKTEVKTDEKKTEVKTDEKETEVKTDEKETEVKTDEKEKEEKTDEKEEKMDEKQTEEKTDSKSVEETIAYVKDAEKWLMQGKRNLVCGEVVLAVQQLQEACRMLAEKYGETAKECGEAYLCYGSALLDLSRMESGVLGNALQGIEEEDSQDEDEKSSESKSEASEQFEDPSKLTEDEGTGTEGEGTEEEGEGEAEAEGTEEEDEDAGTSQDEGESTEDKPEEDVSNLQLAWEMLELAKVIFSKEETKESKLKIAEAALKLGEVGLETESYDQSVQDFGDCLKIQTEILDKEDRKIAETYYQLGLAFNFSGKHDDAVVQFKKASDVIETKIASLTKVIEEAGKSGKGKESASADDPIVAAQKELNDLKELLPDMINKIKDTEEEKANEEKVKQMVKENVTSELASVAIGFGAPAPAGSPTKPAQDITHLVRKKRKPEEDPVSESGDAEAKKPRQEPKDSPETKPKVDGSGDAKATNGQVNGNGKEASPKNGKDAAAAPEEIKTKTVDDVKKLSDEPMEMETEPEKAS